jgi:probable F420-dependent oxidoreductase
VRFSVALLADHHETADPNDVADAVTETAVEAERLGYDAVFVTDHPAPDSRWLAGGGHQALEPTVALSFAAAATTTLRLHTNIYVLAYRNPFLAARSLGSLHQLSRGRLVIGVAAGYLRPEFAALGIPFDERNARLDESLHLLRRLWSGEEVAGDGLGWQARGVHQLPALVGRPPLWIGGNSTAAMRRAATLGDGWSPFPAAAGLSATAKTAELSNLDQLAASIDRFVELCHEAGRAEPLDICMGAFGFHRYLSGEAPASEVVDEYRALADMGVTWATVGFGPDDGGRLERMARFAGEVIAPLAAS